MPQATVLSPQSNRPAVNWGIISVINHGFGYETVYAHLDHFNVREGQKVKRGDIIGYVGSTGLSTAPHLHYEVKVNGNNVDPALYFFNDLTPVNMTACWRYQARADSRSTD